MLLFEITRMFPRLRRRRNGELQMLSPRRLTITSCFTVDGNNMPLDIYGLRWDTSDRFEVERTMIKRGGMWVSPKTGLTHGLGIAHHYKEAIKALWPSFKWHRWSDLLIKTFAENCEIGVMGPASSGKTFCEVAFALTMFYVWNKGTTVLMSTTTRDALELRCWGVAKELHNKAKERRPGLPGKIIDSKFTLTDEDPEREGRDLRDALRGIACKVGGEFVGISNYVGIKNDRIILIADEASLMEHGFLDAVSNLRKGTSEWGDFKLIASGNPKDRNDALGKICEPAADAGGWEGLEHSEKTRTWKTRSPGGIAVQLCGYDSPNFDFPRGVNPFKGIITPEAIEADLAYYGRDSLQFSMMNLGILPKDGGTRRVVTMSLCEQNHAFDEVSWAQSDKLIRCVGIDAAYSAIGGDRCVLTDVTFGPDVNGNVLIALTEPQTIIPVSAVKTQQAEEQIAEYVRLYCEIRKIPPGNAGFDSTGRGTLMSAFARLWSPSVIPVEFGGKPLERPVRLGDTKTEREAYGKMVTALWYASRLVIEGKQMRGLSREAAEEASSREWGVNKDGKVDVEPKEKTKERMGRSPDLWDSLVVAIEIARKLGFSIASGAKVGIKRRETPVWLKKKRENYQKMMESHSLVA